jgi:hypothetical protein
MKPNDFEQNYDKLYSKIETAHRCIYNRHKETEGIKESIKKGKEIVE